MQGRYVSLIFSAGAFQAARKKHRKVRYPRHREKTISAESLHFGDSF